MLASLWKKLQESRAAERDDAGLVTDARRSRIIVLVALIIGGSLLAWTLRLPAGDPLFYVGTIALGSVWLAAWWATGRPFRGEPGSVVPGLVVGVAVLVVFLLGAGVVAQIPFLAAQVDALLAHARWGALPLVAVITAFNGITEELFYRGAVYGSFLGKHPVLVSTAAYTAVTALSGLPLLAFAAAVLGFANGTLRRVTGGLIAPILCHLTWSLGMLFLLGPTLNLWRLS